jgi:hypothetical protein
MDDAVLRSVGKDLWKRLSELTASRLCVHTSRRERSPVSSTAFTSLASDIVV